MTSSKQPIVADKQPIVADKQPIVADKQPIVADKQLVSALTSGEASSTSELIMLSYWWLSSYLRITFAITLS